MANGVIIREIPARDDADIKFGINTSSDIQNGSVVTLGALATGMKDVYVAAAPVAGTDELWLVTSPELDYDERHHSLAEFINEKGKPFRVERCAAGIQIAISKENLTIGTESTDLVAGAVVVATAAMKLTVKASAANNDIVVGDVKEVYTKGNIKFASIRFLPVPYKAVVGG